MSFLYEENHTIKLIDRLLKRKHDITIFSKAMTYSIPAKVIDIDSNNGNLSLEAAFGGKSIDNYIRNEMISFDMAVKGDDGELELFNFENVVAQAFKKDIDLYELKCKLPKSVITNESRGAIRIPFILGMYARVTCEIYEKELSIKAKLRNLSVGGCMIDIPIEESAALLIGQNLPGLSVEFPNGQSFYTKGRIRHMRPFGNSSHAAVGIQFIEVDYELQQRLFYFVSESEREAASRSGIIEKGEYSSPLFIAGEKERMKLQREEKEKVEHSRQPPMVRGIREIAKQLHIMQMFIKNNNIFPEDALYDCADTLIFLIGKDRKALLYSLSFLRGEPEWVRHAVQVAAILADFLIAKDPHAGMIREATAGALLHTMGKPMLLSRRLPSLKANMTPSQKELLKNHVNILEDQLAMLGWQPGKIFSEVILDCNERLDGSGYPAGKTASSLSELTRLVSLIKILNKLMHSRNGVSPRSPLDAYRWVNEHSEMYDRVLLVEYIQIYGLYPIGSLAKFSGGFLAWVLDIDAKGFPNKVQVVKNLSFQDTTIDIVLSTADFKQIGKLEGIVDPDDYNIQSKLTVQ
ncbi:hypothetical protein GCM10007160_15770 [Litchfieldella qijiaojingensis]|uniref:PilZ domain-containing protein n=1 Tax=Litchfieldella qijiaojingensis TaxID=980347 RepID=A0ABQ2YP79_9GAMM|nr:PilZ domain-containing protein [Halomonas qijiaojingensis]GGX89255.1 hypothetical protein GCM10007160_15770 [Halomonas qijiaojingensis]